MRLRCSGCLCLHKLLSKCLELLCLLLQSILQRSIRCLQLPFTLQQRAFVALQLLHLLPQIFDPLLQTSRKTQYT